MPWPCPHPFPCLPMRLPHHPSPCQVCHEEMLLRVAREQAALAAAAAAAAPAAGEGGEGAVVPAGQGAGTASPVTCYYLGKELRRVVEEEWVLRAKLWSEGAPVCPDLLVARTFVCTCARFERGLTQRPAAKQRTAVAAAAPVCMPAALSPAPWFRSRSHSARPPCPSAPQACATRAAVSCRLGLRRGQRTMQSAPSATSTCTFRQASGRGPNIRGLRHGAAAACAAVQDGCHTKGPGQLPPMPHHGLLPL